MFLTPLYRPAFHATCLLAVFLPVVGTSGAAEQATAGDATRQPCFLALPVYDAHGDRLPFAVADVRVEGHEEIDLLQRPEIEYHVSISGDGISFPPNLIGKRRLQITLRGSAGEEITRRVAVMSCQQRTSLERGSLSSGADVISTTVSGRISGCRVSGDWWIRAVPMFGAHESPMVHEGLVRSADGTFTVTSSMTGERHILVIGRGKTPIKAIGIDVVEGGKNDVGVLNLASECPK